MLWKQKTLQQELLDNRRKTISESALIDEVRAILLADELERNDIVNRIGNANPTAENQFNFDLLETERIFHIEQIKNICIDYRLRFLASHLYKSSIPAEAVSKIKALEKSHETTLSGFMIMAPSKQFHLESYDDPLLFAPIGNNYFYLIHKWGNDLGRFRKLTVRPLRDFGSLLLFIALVSLICTFAITELFFEGTQTDVFMLIAFLFTFKSFCGIALYYCFWKGKNFNSSIWDSPYYNR
ncbi:hypothetical protein GR160_07635 [Flavobacterium sp. Sd200]|uniref:hypothetical protein n=1 Tax=Flavobacterium sp. Sd200 TaxID=2692211 RepID=UPI00136F773C|nr:hypothetical protein [Flavobacterium sp. Sd200]MXN91099.1 hypothetical protein [Flavobacterium sp. Sd200]